MSPVPAGLPCPACGPTAAQPLVAMAGVPVMCGVLWGTEAEARGSARGDIELVACTRCHRVCAPEDLVTDRPDVVPVMNNLYEDEIRRTLADLGLDDTTVAVV